MISPLEAKRLELFDLTKPSSTIMQGSQIESEKQKGRRELGVLVEAIDKNSLPSEKIDELTRQLLLAIIGSLYFEDGIRESLAELLPGPKGKVQQQIERTRRMLLDEYASRE